MRQKQSTRRYLDWMSENEREGEKKYLDQSSQDLDRTFLATDEIVALVVAGTIPPLIFEALMRQEIEDCYIRQFMIGLGPGGQFQESEIESILGPLLDFQFEKLRGFVDEIIAGKLSPAQIRARARMYIASARQAFERGRGVRLGWPELPAYAGDCSTQCCTNCRCHWFGVKANGLWHFYWVLDYLAEHCSSPLIDGKGRPFGCLEREVLWNPLIVE